MALDPKTIQAWLAPEKATWIDVADPAQFKDGLAQRKWDIPCEAAGEVVQWLRQYTDVSNTQPIPAVSNPKAKLTTGLLHAMPGIWRSGSVSIKFGIQNPQEQTKNVLVGVIQEIKEGYTTTILKADGAPDFSDIRLVNIRKRMWSAGKYDGQRPEIAFFWPNLAGGKVRACVNQIPQQLDSPVIDGETYTGTWYRKTFDGTREEDGAGVAWATYSTEPDTVTMPSEADDFQTSTISLGRYDTRAAAVSALSSITQTVGKIFHGRVERTAEGYEALVTTETAVLADTGEQTVPDELAPSYLREATNVPAASIATYLPTANYRNTYLYRTEPNISINRFGLFDVKYHQRAVRQYPDPWVNATTAEYSYTEYSDSNRLMRVVTEWDVFTTSMSAAYSAISSASNTISGCGVTHNQDLTHWKAHIRISTNGWVPNT